MSLYLWHLLLRRLMLLRIHTKSWEKRWTYSCRIPKAYTCACEFHLFFWCKNITQEKKKRLKRKKKSYRQANSDPDRLSKWLRPQSFFAGGSTFPESVGPEILHSVHFLPPLIYKWRNGKILNLSRDQNCKLIFPFLVFQKYFLGLPWWSSGWDFALPMQGARVRSLGLVPGQGTRSRMHTTTKKSSCHKEDPTCCN